MFFFLLTSLACGKVQVAANGNLHLLGDAGVSQGLRTWQIHTEGAHSFRAAGDAPDASGASMKPTAPNMEDIIPFDLQPLLQEVKAHAESKGYNEGSGRTTRVGNVSLPLYVLTSNGTLATKRRERLKREYTKHFGMEDEAQWDNMWFQAVPPDMLVDHDDAKETYTVKRKFVRAFASGVESYLIPEEVSHYVSFLAFLANMVESGHDRAFFLEDDINFIPIVEHAVFHDGDIVPWDEVPEHLDEAKKYEYSSDDFKSRFSNSIADIDRKGSNPDVLYVGSIFNNGNTLKIAKGEEAQERSIAVAPSCSDGTHALIISNAGARKLLEKMTPIWLRTDSAIYNAKQLQKLELIPNLVGQRKYWEIYKEVHASTLSSFLEVSASFRVKLALGICIPAWDWAEYAVNVRQDLYFMGAVYVVLAFALAVSCIDRWRKTPRAY